MKTAQEAAREYAKALWNRESALEWETSRDACKSRCERDFLAGVRWAEEWISVSEELPEKYSILLFEVEHAKGIKELHLGTWNGRAWVSVDGCSFLAASKMCTVTDWRPIERKTK